MSGKAVRLKRIYDPPAKADGVRVLVDRLWPRGVRKEEAGLDLWLKEVAPSDELRRWYGHDPARWPGFRSRYARELAQKDRQEALARLRELCRSRRVTLVYGACDEARNNAAVLRDVLLEDRLEGGMD